jgi:hypothetical protein
MFPQMQAAYHRKHIVNGMHTFRELLSPAGDAACAHAVHLREQHNRAAILKAALEPFEFILVVRLHRTRQVR